MGTEEITTLLIDEGFDNAQAVARALSQSRYPRLAVVRAAALPDALRLSQTASVDVTVVALRAFKTAAFSQALQHFSRCPVIVAAEPGCEADAICALDAGAQDYF